MPFDIHIHSAYVEEDFADQLSIIENNVPVKEAYAYHIYENQTTQINVWLYTHLQVFGDMYKKADGSPDLQALLEERNLAYCSYDTYMSLTDYNHLRGMLGLDAIALSNEEYAIHIKDRVFRETGRLFLTSLSSRQVTEDFGLRDTTQSRFRRTGTMAGTM